MEKILSGDDRVRRAEEIYYKRRMKIPNSKFSKIEKEKKTYLGSKILLEILIIINFSLIIIAIQNKDYIFTDKFLQDVQKYNVDITKNIKEFIGINQEEIVIQEPEEDISETENIEIQNNPQEIVPNVEGEASSLNKMDENINKIKELVSIEKPIREGTITSRFGTRESIYKSVNGYHTGIDIGSSKGTTIYAAMARYSKSSIKSSEIIGKHLKIENKGVETLYAHCSKILVKENESVEIGQEIAKVGSTRK